MDRRTRGRRAIALGAVLVLAAPAAAQARDIYATDTGGNLLRFDSRFPGIVLDSNRLTGLPAGVSLVGIDIRPATGGLVGVGTDSVVYAVDAASGGVAPLGAGFAPGLAGTSFGVDVNPVPDALRITSDAEQNYRIAFATGNHAAMSPDGALNPGDPGIVASAYSESTISSIRPATTTLFGIDATAGALVTQSPPNAGTLGNPKPLGVRVGVRTSFDIAGVLNRGYLVTTPPGTSGSRLYGVDLATGAATEIGPVGTGSLVSSGTSRLEITGIAARQESTAPRTNIAPRVAVVATTNRPRPGQRAAYIAHATDPDGEVVRVEWDTDGDGRYDDASGFSARVGFAAGTRRIAVRATDESGARTRGTLTVRVAR